MGDDFIDHPGCRLVNKHIVSIEWTMISIKVFTKQFLNEYTNIRTPELYRYFSKHEVPNLPTDIFDGLPDRYVIKPNARCGGIGVYNIRSDGNNLVEPDGTAWTREDMVKAMWGAYTENEHPSVGTFFEETIVSHLKLSELSDFNEFVELRDYFIHGGYIETLLKIPSKKSAGYGNGCKGAYRVTAVDGVVCPSKHFRFDNTAVDGKCFNGYIIPSWNKALEEISQIPKLFKTQFITVAGTIDKSGHFVVSELAVGPSFPFSKTGKETWRKYKTGYSDGESVAEGWMKKPRCSDCAKERSNDSIEVCGKCLKRRNTYE